MNHAPKNLRFTRNHHWVRIKGQTLVVGLAEYALEQVAHIINVELPEADEHHEYEADEELGAIESQKMTWGVHAPVDGVVIAINRELLHSPELISTDPYGAGWLFQMKPARLTDIENLMDADSYESALPEEDEE